MTRDAVVRFAIPGGSSQWDDTVAGIAGLGEAHKETVRGICADLGLLGTTVNNDVPLPVWEPWVTILAMIAAERDDGDPVRGEDAVRSISVCLRGTSKVTSFRALRFFSR